MRLRQPTSPLFPYTTLFRSTVRVSTGAQRRIPIIADSGHRPEVGHLTEHGPEVPADAGAAGGQAAGAAAAPASAGTSGPCSDRKSTRLNSSHANISYAVFCF